MFLFLASLLIILLLLKIKDEFEEKVRSSCEPASDLPTIQESLQEAKDHSSSRIHEESGLLR